MGQMKPAIVLVVTWGVCFGAAGTAALDSCAQSLSRAEYADAARTASVYIRTHPRSAGARVLLARAHLGLNDAPSALRDLREALRLDPNNLDALYYCSKLASLLANEQFMTLARIAPDSARFHQLKAEGLSAHGDDAGAESEYRIALEKRPGTKSIMIALGDLKRAAADYGAAIDWYEKVLALDAENYDALYGAAVCHFRNGDLDGAISLFHHALKVDPASLASKMALGETLLASGKASQAVPLLEEAAQADRNLRRLQFLLFRAYRAAGRQEDAERAIKRYRELDTAHQNTPEATTRDEK